MIPAYGITPPGTLGYQPPRCSTTTWRRRASYWLKRASRRRRLAGLELTHNTSESHLKIAVALQQMWKDALTST
ncbi:MAG: hypothetical protein IPG64_20255 [Haliea sp.]|nr:hypothetical protein [Haliea sp.]